MSCAGFWSRAAKYAISATASPARDTADSAAAMNERPDGKLREVGRGDDGKDAGQGFGTRGIDAADAGVRMRAAQHLGVHHAGEAEVGGVDGLAGDALPGIDAGHALADDLELSLVRGHGSQRPGAAAAATAAMASTILP